MPGILPENARETRHHAFRVEGPGTTIDIRVILLGNVHAVDTSPTGPKVAGTTLGSGQRRRPTIPHPKDPSGGPPLFCEDVLCLTDRAGTKPLPDAVINTHTHTHTQRERERRTCTTRYGPMHRHRQPSHLGSAAGCQTARQGQGLVVTSPVSQPFLSPALDVVNVPWTVWSQPPASPVSDPSVP